MQVKNIFLNYNMVCKLSVITINYNDKSGLEKTIKSVVDQTYSDFEYVVIDGNSSDGGKELLNLYKDKFAYCVSEPDTGIYNAMNKGIKAANGDYLIFMNSGDTFYDEKVLENVLPYLDGTKDFVYGNSYFFTDAEFIRIEKPPRNLNFDYFEKLGLNQQAVFIKRQLFFDTFLYNENYKISADWEFFIVNICLHNSAYKYIDLIICRYNIVGVSSFPENQKLFYAERQLTFQKYFPVYYKYEQILEKYKSKRFQQFEKISKTKIAWKIMRTILNIFMFFMKK